MKSLLIATLLAAAPLASQTHELGVTFGDAIKVFTKGGQVTVEYCPDNTCEAFALRGARSTSVVQDFAFVYLLGISDSYELQSFQAAAAESSSVRSVLARYQKHFPQPSPREAARCVVGHLARKHAVQASFVRYDEGSRNVVPIPLDAYRK